MTMTVAMAGQLMRAPSALRQMPWCQDAVDQLRYEGASEQAAAL